MHYLFGFVPAAIVGLTAAVMHLVEEVTEREWIGFLVIVVVSLTVSVGVLGTAPNRAAITHAHFVQMVLGHVLPAVLCRGIVKVVAALRDDAEVSP